MYADHSSHPGHHMSGGVVVTSGEEMGPELAGPYHYVAMATDASTPTYATLESFPNVSSASSVAVFPTYEDPFPTYVPQ